MMAERKLVIHPQAPIHVDDRQNLEGFLARHPGVQPIAFAIQYFGDRLPPGEIINLFTTPEQLEPDGRLYLSLAVGLNDLISHGFPDMHTHYAYNKKEATRIVRLFNELPSDDDESSVQQNPFQGLMPLRHLREEAGVILPDVLEYFREPVHFGNLLAKFSLNKPENSGIKKAIRDSIYHNSQVNRLMPEKIGPNVQRIMTARTMVSVDNLRVI